MTVLVWVLQSEPRQELRLAATAAVAQAAVVARAVVVRGLLRSSSAGGWQELGWAAAAVLHAAPLHPRAAWSLQQCQRLHQEQVWQLQLLIHGLHAAAFVRHAALCVHMLLYCAVAGPPADSQHLCSAEALCGRGLEWARYSGCCCLLA
eukprot:CAMPEP_0202352236 /NCGR_PEP_ID=MMETSP1126-20121109/8513_1 /ASSEMBLY_ACC=CAM_ASM_000457 /TAXON_ID=3047 /ORGANISM="Dunaliella tertiolecta, Strain CCMP1320" /LENGTH=148 /DNA_ID=CAMNT_0048944415 /DNA_START=861 /DNA_END=1307 /DNA_ORIENTATION=-